MANPTVLMANPAMHTSSMVNRLVRHPAIANEQNRSAQPLKLLHIDKDGAPVYAYNGNSGLNFLPGSQSVVQKNLIQSHDKGFSSPNTDEGVDPLEGLDPYENEEGVDPLEGYDSSSGPKVTILDSCSQPTMMQLLQKTNL